MKKGLKKIWASVLVLVLLGSFGFNSRAESILANNQTIVLDNQTEVAEEFLYITEETARYVATFFICDMIQTGDVRWSENTVIVDVKEMYNTQEETSAYSVELDQGYVVVSARLDVPNIILEWSDISLPVYAEMSIGEEDLIVYTGALNYYIDNGTEVLYNMNNQVVDKASIEDYLSDIYDISNVPVAVLDNSQVAMTAQVNEYDPEIEDPYANASEVYGGTYIKDRYDSYENWYLSETYEVMSSFSIDANGEVRDNHCGPTAITNMIITTAKAKGIQSVASQDPLDIFTVVADLGSSGLIDYYNNERGTFNWRAGGYIQDSFSEFGISVSRAKKYISSSTMKASFSAGDMVYIMLLGDWIYGDHHVAGYGLLSLYNSTSGAEVNYIKIADGWNSSPRYLDVEVVAGYGYFQVTYEGHE